MLTKLIMNDSTTSISSQLYWKGQNQIVDQVDAQLEEDILNVK